MDENKILQLAEQRGLTRWAKIGDGYNYKDDSLNTDIMIYPEKDEF